MNNKFLLTEILEGCEGMEFYTTTHGNAKLVRINDTVFPLEFRPTDFNVTLNLSRTGGYTNIGECIVFPSEDQRDWSKFEKPSKFPKTYEEARLKFNEDILQCIDEELRDLFKLIVIRDAWWEADNNWRPDWNDYAKKFVLMTYEDTIIPGTTINRNIILSFRTSELRDRFLETHRNLIEACKDYI